MEIIFLFLSSFILELSCFSFRHFYEPLNIKLHHQIAGNLFFFFNFSFYFLSENIHWKKIFFFYFTILYWFCHTSTWICHRCTHIPHPESPSHLSLHTIPLGHPSASAPSILYHASNLDWLFVSHMILYMFQYHSPKKCTLCSLTKQPAPSSPVIAGFKIWF